jgi:hypothetical protein
MFDEFRNLGEHERFVIDSTAMTVTETTATVLQLIAADELLVRL